jgi:hypothetical protein
MSVSTAPISRAFRVSSTPKQYLPVSWNVQSLKQVGTFHKH